MDSSSNRNSYNESEAGKTSGTLISCKECGKVLKGCGALYNHVLKHKGIKRNMCGFCGKLFISSGQLKVHERKHTLDKPFVCQVCGKSFSHRQSLITHNTIHTGIRPFVCESCKNSFSCIGNLLKHRKVHLKTCGQFPLKNHTVNNPDTFTKIKLNTPVTSKLKKAKEAGVLENKKSVLECSCNPQLVKECDNQNGILEDCSASDNLHLLQKTDNGKETILTEFVPLETGDSKQRNKGEFNSKKVQRIVSISNKVDRTFSCKTCGKKCKWKGQLKIHERSHTGEKPFTCLYCPKAFAYRESLLTHSTLHTGVKPHSCEVCGARFSCVGNLNKHKNRHKKQPHKSNNEVGGI